MTTNPRPADYKHWTPGQLIERLAALESLSLDLRLFTTQEDTSATAKSASSPSPPSSQPSLISSILAPVMRYKDPSGQHILLKKKPSEDGQFEHVRIGLDILNSTP
ncbi:hypothetical protein D9756_003677 [Leucocoprinus leucothites]|uniref:Uncharacterized protein n=1 Tax=Leucocoprinus leucothites TaxID=201217 RepID=A0A8H5LFN3_9AGAR|nr:hypothetical protein D9756_003677 [Leucoagaricus leucothites]